MKAPQEPSGQERPALERDSETLALSFPPSPLPPSHEVTRFLFHVFFYDVPTKTRCLAIGQPDWDLQNVTLDTSFLFMCFLFMCYRTGKPTDKRPRGEYRHYLDFGNIRVAIPRSSYPEGLYLFQGRLVLGCQRRAEVQVSFPPLLHTGDSPLKSFTLEPLVGPISEIDLGWI